MLSLEPPYYEIDGTIIYRDHAVAEQFYYTAPDPEIARSGGRLLFDIFAYAVELEHSPLAGTSIPEELGAGFLTMGTECKLSNNQLSNIKSQLSGLIDLEEAQIALYPVPYQKGTVKVLALDNFSAPEGAEAEVSSRPLTARPTFVEKVLGSAVPSLLGGLRTIFSLSLSQEGVSFLQGLYRDNAAPVGVVYELDFYGLRPSVEARVTANLSRIYQHFGGGLSVSYKWVGAEIDAALDDLEEQGYINIELISQAVGEEAAKSKELALSLFKEKIIQEMFRPTSPASKKDNFNISNILGNKNSKSMVNLTLKYKKREELKEVTYDFSERAPAKRTHAPQAFLPMLLSPHELNLRIHNIDLDSDFFNILEVLVTGPTAEEFDALKIRQVAATLTYGSADDGRPPQMRTLLFRRDDTGDKIFAVKRRGRRTLSYECKLVYEFMRESGTDADSFRYELASRTLKGRTMRINPYQDFGILDVELELGRIHSDIKVVDVDLVYDAGDSKFYAEEKFRFQPEEDTTAQQKRWQVRTLAADIKPYQINYCYYFDDGTVYRESQSEQQDNLVRIDAPFNYERRLLLQPNVAEQVTDITVELDYMDQVHDYRRNFLVNLKQPFANKEIKWALLDRNMQTVNYRVTVHEPGFSSTGEWQETADPSIVIGGAISRRSKIQVKLVGPPLHEIGLDALQLNIKLSIPELPETEINSLLFDGTQREGEVILTLPPGTSLQYEHQKIYYKASGDIVESEWEERTNNLLVISTRN